MAILLAAGCSSGSQQNVFFVGRGFTTGFPAHTDEVDDVGLSVGWLDNTSSHDVRLLSVRFAAPPASLHMLNVYAYRYADVHNGLISLTGVLSKECPREFKPQPVSVVTVAPHSNATWLVVLAFTISKPGIYHLDQVRIDYQTQGRRYWQYQNVFMTITIKNPPLPGDTPLPSSVVCNPNP
jgi:hypothetical protein